MTNRVILLIPAILFLSAYCCEAQEPFHTKPSDASTDSQSETESWSLYDIITEDTMQMLLDDKRLRSTYRAAVSVCADTSRSLADQLEVPELSFISNGLSSHLREFDSEKDVGDQPDSGEHQSTAEAKLHTKRAGLLSSLLFGSSKDGAKAGGGESTGPITGAIASAASSIVGRVLNMSGPAVAQAGFFGGVGAGEGAAQGLNLASAGASMDTGSKVAQENGMKSAGFNSAIESAAMGLTATALRAVSQSSTFQMSNLGPVAMAMGGGIGNGAATGLKLTTDNGAPSINMNASSLDGIVGNFAFGLSRSFTETANVSNLFNQVIGQNGASMTSMLLKVAAPAVSGFGKGLGSGTAMGLGLQPGSGPAAQTMADGSVDVGGIMQDFASGLTSRFLANGTATNAIGRLLGGGGLLRAMTTDTLLKNIRPAASGLGKGLGSGTAVGLSLQPDSRPEATANAIMADGSVDVGGIVQDFASSLASRFLANGTAIKAIGSLLGLTGGLATKLDVARIGRGLGTGLVTGAGDATQALGGLKSIVDGQATMPTTPVVDSPVSFNDTVGGAATGFGQGLANSAVLTAFKLLSGGVEVKAPDPRGTAKMKRSTSSAVPFNPATRVHISNEVNVETSNLLLTPEAMSGITQRVVSLLTSEGVGSLALIALGISKSGIIPAAGLSPAGRFDANTTRFIKEIIPKGTLSFTKDGNTYGFNGQQLSKALNGSLYEAANGLSINNSTFSRFVVLLLIHVFFAVVVFAVFLPLALTLHSSRNILLQLQTRRALPAWTLTATKAIWAIGIAPSCVIVLIFGLLLGPTGAHFQTTHGILGLMTLLVTVTAVTLYSTQYKPLANITACIPVISQCCSQLLLVLALPTLITGFSDVSTITQSLTRVVPFELAISLGSALGSMLVIGQVASGLDLFLKWEAEKRNSLVGQRKRSVDVGVEKVPLH